MTVSAYSNVLSLTASAIEKIVYPVGCEPTQILAKRVYDLYTVTVSYPARPLSALWGPALTAANYFAPNLLKRIDSALPDFIRGVVAYETDMETLSKETALALLFIGLASENFNSNRKVSIAIMGILARLVL